MKTADWHNARLNIDHFLARNCHKYPNEREMLQALYLEFPEISRDAITQIYFEICY